jgi:hypothetical protein
MAGNVHMFCDSIFGVVIMKILIDALMPAVGLFPEVEW